MLCKGLSVSCLTWSDHCSLVGQASVGSHHVVLLLLLQEVVGSIVPVLRRKWPASTRVGAHATIQGRAPDWRCPSTQVTHSGATETCWGDGKLYTIMCTSKNIFQTFFIKVINVC